MKITPQDIIDKEFRVKFRGFDMAEVDAFLEEVAENFFKLTEENTLLHEKVLALQRDLEAKVAMSPQGQVELPAELGTMLEDLKQDTAAISAELTGLKHDRQGLLDSLEKNLKAAVASIEAAAGEKSGSSADLGKTLEDFRQGTAAIEAELTGLKKDRQTFIELQKSFELSIKTAKEAASAQAPRQGKVEMPGDLAKTLQEFMQSTETIGTGMAALQKDLGAIANIRTEIKEELQELINSRFAELEAKIATVSPAQPPAAPKATPAPKAAPKKEKLAVAEIVEEPDEVEEDTRLPDYEEQDEGADDSALEFLSEDDILDVDKLRGIFQSVLDEGISDAPESRDGDDVTADLLFLEDDFLEDEHEPEVTFSLDEKEPERQPKLRKS